MMRILTAMGAVALAGAMLACGDSALDRAVADALADATATATPTAIPTATPTAIPTAIPTATPTPLRNSAGAGIHGGGFDTRPNRPPRTPTPTTTPIPAPTPCSEFDYSCKHYRERDVEAYDWHMRLKRQ